MNEMDCPIILKTGTAKETYYLNGNVRLINNHFEGNITSESEAIKTLQGCPKLITKGKQYSCVIKGDELHWVDDDKGNLESFFDDSYFENIEVCEAAWDSFKESRINKLLDSLSSEDIELLKEHLNE
jgi:hypothetical protein